MTAAKENLLEISHLSVDLGSHSRPAHVVTDLSLSLLPGEMLALVGESGSGKSMTALAVMGLLPTGARRTGTVCLGGRGLTRMSEGELRHVRGNEIGMVFQEPMTSLDPVFTIGDQILETIRAHRKVDDKSAIALAVDALDRVGIANPRSRMHDYPHQLSGGMCQRVMIAMALVLRPGILIADEPTTALDVTIQAQIIELIQGLQQDFGMSVLLITHNLALAAERTQRVAVMYAGEIVELGSTHSLLTSPKHPYTQGLLDCTPSLDRQREYMHFIKGRVPDPHAFPAACRFAPRCPYRIERCTTTHPVLEAMDEGRQARCWNPQDYVADS